MTQVCMIVNKYYYYDPRVRRYAEALVDAGTEVDVLCTRETSVPPSAKKNGVGVITIPIGRARGGVARYFLQYGAALCLFSVWLLVLFVKKRYKVIHVHNPPDFLVFSAFIPRIFGAKVILDIHDPMPDFFMTKFRNPRTNYSVVRLMRTEEMLSAALAHAVITVNADVKGKLVKRGMSADKITVVRNMPDMKRFDRKRYKNERDSKDNGFTLIYPGTVTPQYGLDVAIRALPFLTERIPQLRLRIIGPQGEHAMELARLAEQLGVSSTVQFKPSIPVDEVPQQLAQADVGIYPGLHEPYMNMATPTKVLEYAAMGLPIIASRLTALEELFSDRTVLFFDAGNVDQFARCVLDLWNSPSKRDELVRNADTVLARTYSWKHEQQEYFVLLNRLLVFEPGAGLTDIGEEKSARGSK